MMFGQYVIPVWLGIVGVYYLTRKRNKHISKNLLDMNVEQKREFLNCFDYVLSDLDGVVWLIYKPLPGTATAVNMLQEDGKQVIFVTNNSYKTESEFQLALSRGNISTPTDNIMFPSKAAILYLKQINFTDTVFVIGGAVIRKAFFDAGFNVIYENDNATINTLQEILAAAADTRQVGAVYIDTDINLSYLKMLKASQFLRNPNCLFLIGPTDLRVPIGNDALPILGPTSCYKIIEEVTNRKATVLGKPGLMLRDIIMKKYGINHANRVLFIGDSLPQDIGFGRLSGFKTLLVLTGITSRRDLEMHKKSDELPDYYLDSLSDLAIVYNDANK